MLRIATFNLESLDDKPGLHPTLTERAEAIRPKLLHLGADVLCLQEIHGQWSQAAGERRLLALDELLAGTPYADFQRVSTSSRAGHGVADVHNLVILSRYRIEESHEVRHDLVPPPRYRPVTAEPPCGDEEAVEWDRPALAARIALPGGQTLQVVNLHLRAPLASVIEGRKTGPFSWQSVGAWAEGFFLANIKRSGQALEARLMVEQIFDADPQALIAVCGDFNAELPEMPLRILRGDTADTGNGELAARVLAPLDARLSPDQRFSLRHGGRQLMFDHLLASPALQARCVGLEVLNQDLIDEITAPAGTPDSFHAPVVASFDI